MFALIFYTITLLGVSKGLIGYDCGSSHLNVTTLSLRDVGECEIPEDNVNVFKTYVQLLQLNEYSEINVIQCKVEIHRTAYYCGMHSHLSIVENGENEYIHEISYQACQQLHVTGIITLAHKNVVTGVKVNSTVTRPILLAGHIQSSGYCEGEGYSDPYGSFSYAVVQGTVKITLASYTARAQLNENKIHLRSGTVCTLSDDTCIDLEGGYTFWKSIPSDTCKFDRYGVLYEGLANKIIDLNSENKETLYTLTTDEITFALTAKGRQRICGYELVKTEHPKLLIFETNKGDEIITKKPTSVANLDIFAYMNSKFMYVEKHIRTQMKQLYRDVTIQKCALERQTIKNSLSLATRAPDEFAHDLMKGPGYMAVVAGEVVHIIKCIPVEVKVKHSENCYAELEVSRNNETLYLTPRTHILKERGTRMPCNPLLPSFYFVGTEWYKIMPRPTEAKAPYVISPNSKPTWKYVNPASLATSGIYSEKDLDQLRERIMFPVERPAVLNDIAREMRGHPVTADEASILKLLNENALEKLVDSTWTKIWTRFMTFGTASAGVIAILMIIHVIKLIVDVTIRGCALHTIYGWSIHLLGAVWSSITHFLLYMYKQEEKNMKKAAQDVELATITATAPTLNSKDTEEVYSEESEIKGKNSNIYPKLDNNHHLSLRE